MCRRRTPTAANTVLAIAGATTVVAGVQVGIAHLPVIHAALLTVGSQVYDDIRTRRERQRVVKLKAQPCAAEIIRSARGTAPCPRQNKAWVLAVAVLGSTMAFVDESVVNVALPRIEADLHTTLASMQWIINAYTLCMSALLLIGGAAADRFGRRRLFLSGVVTFTLASIVCGAAPNVPALIAARAIQGVGAALLIPCSLAIIGAAFDEQERGAAIGIWSGASALAAGISITGSAGDNTIVGGFGNDSIDMEARSGARFTLVFWFDPNQTVGLQGSGFFLGDRTVNFTAGSPGKVVSTLRTSWSSVVCGTGSQMRASWPGLRSVTVVS